MRVYIKDPDATLDYAIDWSAGGYLAGQTIIASSWQVTPVETGGITIASQALNDNTASVTLDGGVRGHLYRVVNHISLSNGVVDERGFALQVGDRV